MQKYLFVLLFVTLLVGFKHSDGKRSEFTIYVSENNLKASALTVLEQKCNICHSTKNKSVIYTNENMDSKAKDIHYQVFVKKRMPKGKVKLTVTEMNALRIWLDSKGMK